MRFSVHSSISFYFLHEFFIFKWLHYALTSDRHVNPINLYYVSFLTQVKIGFKQEKPLRFSKKIGPKRSCDLYLKMSAMFLMRLVEPQQLI